MKHTPKQSTSKQSPLKQQYDQLIAAAKQEPEEFEIAWETLHHSLQLLIDSKIIRMPQHRVLYNIDKMKGRQKVCADLPLTVRTLFEEFEAEQAQKEPRGRR